MKMSILLSSVLWFFLCSCGCATEARLNSTPASSRPSGRTSGMKHLTVYQEAGKFCGWPANNGAWSWGNEILVCFDLHYFKEPDRSVDPTEHHVDWEKPGEIVMARSIDGGESWTPERPRAFSASQSNNKATLPPKGIDFAHPDFAMRMRGTVFHISYDRGRTWHGPYRLPNFGVRLSARTDYIVDNTTNCLLFLSAARGPLCVQTTDAGKTFTLLSNMASATEARFSARSIMPSSARISQDQVITAVRQLAGEPNVSWVDVLASNDNGKTWTFLSKVADADRRYWNGNPPSMVRLADGGLCVTYGYRAFPYGIRAKISTDNGKTWGDEIILRADGRNWDLGYSRTVQRPDGKLVTMYYYSTDEQPQQHIAATIWDPNLVDAHSWQRHACERMSEHVQAIDTSIAHISRLSNQKIKSINTLVWWTQEKEMATDRLIKEAQFLLAEQPKSAAKRDAEACGDDSTKVTLLQQILFYSGWAKKTNALSNVEQLTCLLDDLKQAYSVKP